MHERVNFIICGENINNHKIRYNYGALNMRKME
jgi:hypothetical protein